jgi:MFS family permease
MASDAGNPPSLPPVPPPARRDPYAALRHAPYRHFLLGRLAFMIAGQMQTAAVGWQIYERLGSVMALGYVGLVQIIPLVCLALPAGHAADRFNRKTILLLTQAAFFCCSLGLAAVSHYEGRPIFIYAILLLLAIARAFTIPAIGALLPTVIPREVWANAATWNSTLFELTGLVGPALAGALIAVSHGATIVYLAAAGCVAMGLVLFSRLRPAQRVAPKKAATWADLLGGLRFVFRTRLLLAAASLDLFAVLLGGATALLPVVAKDILHAGPEGFGWLRAAPSIGAMLMALWTVHLPPWRRAGRVLLWAFVGFGAATIVFGFSTHLWLSMAMLILIGVFDNLNVVIRNTLVQYITPDEMRGRVSAVNFIFIGCSNELGALESGVAARLLGTVRAIAFGGAGTIFVVLAIMKAAPQLRRLGRLHDIQPAPV